MSRAADDRGRGGLVLRRVTADDDAAIRSLLARSYPHNPKARAEFTRWQYWDNPFGPTRGWVWATEAGQIVCHWSAVAVPLLLAGRRVVGAKGVDIATDPDWRGRGLFSALARRMIDDCRAAGVPALLSHPNPGSAGAVERAGARPVARVPAWVRPADPAWLAHRLHLPVTAAHGLARAVFRPRRGRSGGPDLVVTEVSAPPSDLDDLWAAVAPTRRLGVARDRAWWRWRYAARPSPPDAPGYRILEARTQSGGAAGRLRGAAVTTVRQAVGGRFAHVLEWMAADDAAAAALGAALAEPDERGRWASPGGPADGAVVAALPGTRLARHATRSGFRRLPRPLEPRPLRFLVAGGRADDPAGAQRLAKAPWAFAWGDLDHL